MQKKDSKFYEELAKEVLEDFKRRQEERREIEDGWRLNINYLMGNQYCEILPSGEVSEEDKYYYWQNRNVYNHIAPIVETRVAKLSRVRPIMSVRAQGGEDCDVKTAKIATNVLNSTYHRLALDGIITQATHYSEVFGSSFYKIVWNNNRGCSLGDSDGERVYEGDVDIIAVSPFEIYPDSLFRPSLSEVKSLIHARAMRVDDIEELYGVRVEGADVDVFKLEKASGGKFNKTKISSGIVSDNAIVIERYERPTKAFPNGRVITVAGDKIVAISELPYVNGKDFTRDFPFVKQDSISVPTCFFGTSVIERLLPLQRAYNAIKNRKHEFLNRLSMGVITVEDGSIDTDELVEEGLSPGKVIVYRQGANPPQIMESGRVPIDFAYEEEKLTNEFISVSGVSEISRSSAIPDNVTSGVALQVLLEQDETRLNLTADEIKLAIKTVAKHILRLFKQFSSSVRMMKIAGDSQKAEVFYFNSSDLTSDDVVFDTENEISTTPAQKKSAVLELFQTGLFSGSNGKIDERTKSKILEIMGFGSLDNANDLTNLHISKALKENLDASTKDIEPSDYDDHDVHILEHTRYLLSGEENADRKIIEGKIATHINKHKLLKNINNQSIESRLSSDGN